jgi:hypothetical protein
MLTDGRWRPSAIVCFGPKRTPGYWSHRQCGAQIASNLISMERRLKLFDHTDLIPPREHRVQALLHEAHITHDQNP